MLIFQDVQLNVRIIYTLLTEGTWQVTCLPQIL